MIRRYHSGRAFGLRAAHLRGAVFGGLVALVAGGASCTSLPDIQAGMCGNGVVEPDHNEDCDNQVKDEAGKAVCYPAGSPAQCHFDCSTAPCPTGFSCGADAVCRKPAGVFGELGHGLQVDADQLLTGDFDHDGLGDVVARTDVQMNVLFGDSTGFGAPVTIRAPSSNPAVGQLGLDPAAPEPIANTDLVFSAGGGGVTTWIGGDDRTLEPTPYPSFQLSGQAVQVFEIRILQATDDIVAFLPADVINPALQGGFFVSIGGSETLGSFGVFSREPLHSPSDLVGDVRVAQLDERPTSPCEEFTGAFIHEDHVSVYTPCSSPTTLNTFDPSNPNGQPGILPTKILLGGAKIRGGGLGVRLADINGDGHLDLYIDATIDDTDKSGFTMAAYGLGDGTFNSDPALTGTPNVATVLPVFEAPVLAIGQLTNDKEFDYVTRDGIFLRGPVDGAASDAGINTDGGDIIGGVAADQPWGDAVIADLDGDSVPDVVAGGVGRVDYYRGSNTLFLSHVPYAVDGTASEFTVGFFDDDLAPDIALRAVHDDNDPAKVTADLDVLWGRFLNVPQDPITVGHFGPIASISTGVIAGSVGNNDFFNDLGVIVGNSATPFSISVIASSSDRELQSPLYIQESKTPVTPIDPATGKTCTKAETQTRHTGGALAFGVGQLDAEDRHPDLVTAASVVENSVVGNLARTDLELAISKTTNQAQLVDSNASDDPTGNEGLLFTSAIDSFDSFVPSFFTESQVPCAPLPNTPFQLAAADWRRLSIATVDFDGPSSNGVDEIVGVAPALRLSVGFNESPANTLLDTSASGRFFWAKKENGTWSVKGTQSPGVLPAKTAQNPVASVSAADLDGDGAGDVLLLVAGRTSNTLVVYMNEKNGQLPASPIPISLPDIITVKAEKPATITSAAAIDADSSPGKEVALLTDNAGLFMAKWNAQSSSFDVSGPLCKGAPLDQCVNSPTGRIPSGNAIAAADVDGDGVTDLVIEESNLTLHVFKGQAVDP